MIMNWKVLSMTKKFYNLTKLKNIKGLLTETVDKLDFLWSSEALDGDGTEGLSDLFLVLLNERNGNLGKGEFKLFEGEAFSKLRSCLE